MVFGRRFNGDPRSFAALNYLTSYSVYPEECYQFTTSFDITLAAAWGRDHFYLVGVADSGEEVIEQWKKAPAAPTDRTFDSG